MKTDNELIHEFMGYDWTKERFEWRIAATRPMALDDLSYYQTSWNWLMPVVERIESMAPNRVVIDCNECRIIADKRFKVHTLKKINSVYQCVVQFIKWYNENKA